MKSILIFILTIFLVSPFLASSQIQIGQDIDGEAIDNNFGEQVRLSSNGNILAVLGSLSVNDGNVRVFENVGGNWQIYGTDSQGDHFGGGSYISIDLTDDGTTLAAAGSNVVKVFTYQSGVWTQKGPDIQNNTSVNDFGFKVSLSQDANTIAISAPSYVHSNSRINIPPPPDFGFVQIFTYDSGTWNQVGDDIVGQIIGERSGRNICLSADGNVVAISNHNSIRIFENNAGVWTLKGSEILGVEFNPKSVCLSSDGNIVAFGDYHYSVGIIQSGRVQVFEFISGDWVQIGSDILGDESQNYTGESVSLSSSGDVLAVGEVGNDTGMPDRGRVRIFKNLAGFWYQVGTSILGEGSGDYSGNSVNLSSNASTIAIGAALNDGNGEDSGHVRVYDLSSTLSSNEFVLNKFRLIPNPVKDEFMIKLQDGIELQKVNLYNSLGQLINSIRKSVANISKLTPGIYYVELITDRGRASKKIVVN